LPSSLRASAVALLFLSSRRDLLLHLPLLVLFTQTKESSCRPKLLTHPCEKRSREIRFSTVLSQKQLIPLSLRSPQFIFRHFPPKKRMSSPKTT
jgi:hypothetical protein